MLKLYDYQLDYIRHAKPNWIYDCDTGVGKTVMALAHYRIHGNNAHLCIIAPASKIKEGGWQRTCELMCPNLKVKFISYNVISKFAEDLRNYFIIFDESHRIKDSCGVWGKAAYKICQNAVGFIFLSATPIPNDWADAINYFKIFGITKNKTQFLQRFAITNNRWGYMEIVGWRNSRTLLDEWKSISKRLNKEECIDLPELIIKDINFKVTSDYKKILSTRMLNNVALDNNMSYRHALRQNCAVISKLDYIKDFLESTKQNVIIFYNYQSELEVLKKIIKNKIVYYCNGESKNFPSILTKVNNSVTLANYKSGSEAVEFTYADIIIYFSPTESYTEYYQSLGRCHRLGQTNKVTVYRFITLETIEEYIYYALNNKQDFNFDLWEEQQHGQRKRKSR
jgi:SNF2 family DNA or RNA helicase